MSVRIVSWFLTPISIPEELLEAVQETARKLGMSYAEYVLVASIEKAGYDQDSVMAARRLCYPKMRRTATEVAEPMEPKGEKGESDA